MSTSPRPELEKIGPCLHGSISDAEMIALGLREVLDFSVSGNPLGPPPGVAAAIAATNPARYPDNECLGLRQAVAARFGLGIERVAVGNGSVELIWLLALAYLRPGDAVVVIGPTFGEYARAASIHSGRVILYSAREAELFRPDLGEVIQLIQAYRPRLVFLCNPNNPTGHYLERENVKRLAHACQDGLCVVDEAYLGFVEGVERWLTPTADNVVCLRSMTKDYGLAGLRLGYAVAAPDVVAALDKVRPPWSVNAAAQAAGLAALAEEAHLDRARQVVAQAKGYLIAKLSGLGLAVMPSTANFLLVRVGDAAAFRAALLAKGCCVRDCASFGLPEYARIGIRPLDECQRLARAVEEVLGGR